MLRFAPTFAVLALVCLCSQASAAIHAVDAMLPHLALNYDATTDTFMASNPDDMFGMLQDPAIPDAVNIFPAVFSLNAVINEFGVSTGNGSFELNGGLQDVDGFDIAANTLLLAGALDSFTYMPGPTYIDLTFIFHLTAGSLATDFGGIGSQVQLEMHIDSNGWDFANSFSDETTSADLFAPPVPEPMSLAIWAGLGIGGVIAARRRRIFG